MLLPSLVGMLQRNFEPVFLMTNFNFFQKKKFVSTIWAAKLRVQLICECGVSAGIYGTNGLAIPTAKTTDNNISF